MYLRRAAAGIAFGLLFVAVSGGCWGGDVQAAVIHVPADHSTIQAAIDAAQDGDVVEIAPGAYSGDGNRDLSFRGKAITIRPRDGFGSVTLDLLYGQDGSHRAFIFDSSEGRDAVLQGIRIENSVHDGGAGVWIRGDAAPTIAECEFTSCLSLGYGEPRGGGGILCDGQAKPLVQRCLFLRCESVTSGSAISVEGSAILEMEECHVERSAIAAAIEVAPGARADIRNCDILDSLEAGAVAGGGTISLTGCGLAGGNGAAAVSSNGTLTMDRCTVGSNRGFSYGGLWVNAGAHASVRNTIFRNNCDVHGSRDDITVRDGGELELYCCAIDLSAIHGDIDLELGAPHVYGDPRLCDAPLCPDGYNSAGTFSIDEYSPCAAAPSPCGEQIGALGVGCSFGPGEGACCLPDGSCLVTLEAVCAGLSGDYSGDGIGCFSNPCTASPQLEESWGGIKARFR